MSHQTKTHGGSMDSFKWAVVFALVGVGVIGNHQFADLSILIRVIALLLISALAIVIALQTNKGKNFWQFAQSARNELRKVVWPSRKETIQTTVMVLSIVAVVGLILWGVDASLLKLIALITGYGAQ